MAYPKTLVKFYCFFKNNLARWDPPDNLKEVILGPPDTYRVSIKLPSFEQRKYINGKKFRCCYHNTQYRYILHNEATLLLQHRFGVGEYSIKKSSIGRFNFMRKILNHVN